MIFTHRSSQGTLIDTASNCAIPSPTESRLIQKSNLNDPQRHYVPLGSGLQGYPQKTQSEDSPKDRICHLIISRMIPPILLIDKRLTKKACSSSDDERDESAH